MNSKSNEITAIHEVLALLDLPGALVTLYAAGCQKSIATQIIEADADYVLVLKDNHPQLSKAVAFWLDRAMAQGTLADARNVGQGTRPS